MGRKYLLITDTKLSKIDIYRVKRFLKQNAESSIKVITLDENITIKLKKHFPALEYKYYNIFVHFSKDHYRDLVFSEITKLTSTVADSVFEFPFLYINTVFTTTIAPLIYLKDVLREELSEYNKASVYLLNGNPRIEFLCIFNSEMESGSRFFYKRSWQINYYIFLWFKERNTIKWIHKTSTILLKVCLLGRRVMIPVLRGIKFCIDFFIAKIKERRVLIGKKPLSIINVRSGVQISPSESLYKHLSRKNETYYVVFNRKLLPKLRTSGLNYYWIYNNKKFKDILGYWVNLNKVRKTFRKIHGEMPSVNISYASIINELLSEYFLDYVALNSFNDFILNFKDKILNVFSFETFSIRAAIDGYVSKKNKIPSYSIQHVSYMEEIRPIPLWTDGLFFMSSRIKEFFKEQYPDYMNMFFYLGPSSYDSVFNTSKYYESKRITIFTQPDYYLEDYFSLIKELLLILKGAEYIVSIKPHPRDKNCGKYNKLKKLYKKVEVFSPDYDSVKLIRNSSLVISIFSSTLFQSLLIGTPFISVNYKKKFGDIINRIDYLNENANLVVEDISDLETILNDIDFFNDEFKNVRTRYINRHFGGYVGSATEKILELLNELEN